jgi:hypothetical protein
MSDPRASFEVQGEIMNKFSTVVIALGLALSGVSPAQADSDPFPGVEHMAEIPGTRVSSPAGFTQSQWESSDTYISYITAGCPAGSGNAVSVNVSQKIWSNYCVKTWRSQSTVDAWQKHYEDEAAAKEAAYQQSLAWNTANPGQQKCFPYGPLTSPDGGTTSGGVCANPVSGPTNQSETVTRTVEREETSTFETSETNNRVSAFLTSVQALPSITKKTTITLPKIKKAKRLGLSLKTLSRSPDVCKVRKSVVRFVGTGDCRVRIVITDALGNRLASTLRVSRA